MVFENGFTDIKKFVISNNIVGTSAGVCVALAAKDGIQSLVNDIIMPSILIVLSSLHIDSLKKYLPTKGATKLNVNNFIKQMITFTIIIVISFMFVKIAFGYLLGIPEKTDPKQEVKPEAKQEVKPEAKPGNNNYGNSNYGMM